MQILIVNFELTGMSDEEFREAADTLAPPFAEVPGLQSKVWLANAGTNTYGGVYSFRTRADLEAFKASDLFAQVGGHPNFTEIRAAEFEILEAPSRITRGLTAAVV